MVPTSQHIDAPCKESKIERGLHVAFSQYETEKQFKLHTQMMLCTMRVLNKIWRLHSCCYSDIVGVGLVIQFPGLVITFRVLVHNPANYRN